MPNSMGSSTKGDLFTYIHLLETPELQSSGEHKSISDSSFFLVKEKWCIQQVELVAHREFGSGRDALHVSVWNGTIFSDGYQRVKITE